MKRLIATLLITALLLSCVGCFSGTNMPFNGDISFHDMTMTIPADFIRDSTQSDDNLWVFEKGRYTQMIILKRNDLTAEENDTLQGYADYMQEVGATTATVDFNGQKAVYTTYTKEEVFCQELLFVYSNSSYAIALRGGSEADFDSLLSSVAFPADAVTESQPA